MALPSLIRTSYHTLCPLLQELLLGSPGAFRSGYLGPRQSKDSIFLMRDISLLLWVTFSDVKLLSWWRIFSSISQQRTVEWSNPNSLNKLKFFRSGHLFLTRCFPVGAAVQFMCWTRCRSGKVLAYTVSILFIFLLCYLQLHFPQQRYWLARGVPKLLGRKPLTKINYISVGKQ